MCCFRRTESVEKVKAELVSAVEYLRSEAKSVVRWQRGRYNNKADLRQKDGIVRLCPLMPAGESFCPAWASVRQCQDIVALMRGRHMSKVILPVLP
ncbi:hypothetical protein STEG23_014544 [Scotinomys teguina]